MELQKLKSKSMGSFYFIDETSPECESLLSTHPSLVPSSVSEISSEISSGNPKPEYKRQCILRSERMKPIPGPKSNIAMNLTPQNILKNLWKLIEILLTFILFLVLFPIFGLILIVFILPTRLLISCAISLDSLGTITLLPLIKSFYASGSEFYTVVHVIRGECDMQNIRNRIEQAVNSTRGDDLKLKYPNLRKRLVKRLGYYCFEDKWEDFHLTNHVKYFDDSGLSDDNGLSQFTLFYLLQDDFESSYFKQDESIPQWEVLVVPKFYYKLNEESILRLDDDKKFYAIVYRANATILDKKTALAIFQDDIIDEDPCTEYVTRLSPKFTKIQEITLFFLTFFLSPWLLLKCLLRNNKPLGNFKKPGENGTDSIPRYLLKSSYPINTACVSGLKDLTRTTVTSTLTSLVGTAARNMILGYNLDLPSKVCVTLRSFVGEKGSESICIVKLHSDKFSVPLDRLHDAFYKIGTRWAGFLIEVEKRCNLMGFFIAGAFPSEVCKEVYKAFHRTNIMIEIWPGVSDPYWIFGGDLVADVFGWCSIAGSTADFGVTITSYAGRMRANFIGDNEALGYHTKRITLPNEFIEEYLKIAEICSLKSNRLIRPGPF